eukprot:879303_1
MNGARPERRGGFRAGWGARGGLDDSHHFHRKQRDKFQSKEKREGKCQYTWGENGMNEVPADVAVIWSSWSTRKQMPQHTTCRWDAWARRVSVGKYVRRMRMCDSYSSD